MYFVRITFCILFEKIKKDSKQHCWFNINYKILHKKTFIYAKLF